MAYCRPALLSHPPQAARGLNYLSLTRGGRFSPLGWPICSETPADLLRKTHKELQQPTLGRCIIKDVTV